MEPHAISYAAVGLVFTGFGMIATVLGTALHLQRSLFAVRDEILEKFQQLATRVTVLETQVDDRLPPNRPHRREAA